MGICLPCRYTNQLLNGDDPEKLAEVGNIADGTLKEKWPDWGPWRIRGVPISAKDGYLLTAPVGRFKPNAWGLYDMHGNAWQWYRTDRADWDYYARSPVVDPPGASDTDKVGSFYRTSGFKRVRRGGSFYTGGSRSAFGHTPR